jgi:hypothetical protein
LSALSKDEKKISFGTCSPKLGDSGVEEVSRMLKKKNDVFWLALFDQEITNDGLSKVLASLMSNKELLHLDLGRNQLGDEGVTQLCSFLTGNKTIREVFLWYVCNIC